jgi:transglutaminase-like putative cysteine protease
MLLLFSLALFLNVAASSAAVVNNTTNSANYITGTGTNTVASNATIKNNTTIKSGTSLNNSTFKAAGEPVLVNGLTLSQMNDGLSRVQAFYANNGRLPNYVSFGTRQVLIATFEQNLATQGLSISVKPNTSSVSALAKSLTVGSTSTYNSAVRIFNWVRDNIHYSFYYNTKYGAAGTLISRTGNCCDTSNLLVALARAAGISARYKSGYCQFNSGTWYGHVWANLYVNGKWCPADAISYSNTFGVINNWNTSNFQLYGIYSTLPF